MSSICSVCGGRIVTRFRDGKEIQVCTNVNHDKIARRSAGAKAASTGKAGRKPGPVKPKDCATCGTPMIRVRGIAGWKWKCENPQHAANVTRNRKKGQQSPAVTEGKKRAQAWKPRYPHPKPAKRRNRKKNKGV